MPVVTLPDGSTATVDLSAIFADDGTTPFTAPLPEGLVPVSQVEAARQQEKDKLYGRIERTATQLAELQTQIGTLTAAQQTEQARLEQEQARLAAEAQAAEEAELDSRSLIERKTQEWQDSLNQVNQTWEQKFAASEAERQAALAQAAKEREFGELRDYILSVTANARETGTVAPQLISFIGGNSKEEVDAALARAVESTESIAAEFAQLTQPQVPGQPIYQQQVPVPQAPPGTRVTTGPPVDVNGQQTQQLTAEQIANMPMDQWAKIRGNLGIGGQGNNRGLLG